MLFQKDRLFRIIRLFSFIVLISAVSSCLVVAEPEWISLKNGSEALLYLPDSFNPSQKYPLLIALHGMGETAEQAYTAWRPVADELKMILLCPKGSNFVEGYTRAPIDDRRNISLFYYLMSKKYLIDQEKSVLAGFSRGGNFAIETGLVYPSKFKNVVCIFGFFLDRHRSIMAQNTQLSRSLYHNSQFYFITGHGDMTEYSLKRGYQSFNRKGISVKLDVYSDLRHAFPPNLAEAIQQAQNRPVIAQKVERHSPRSQVRTQPAVAYAEQRLISDSSVKQSAKSVRRSRRHSRRYRNTASQVRYASATATRRTIASRQ